MKSIINGKVFYKGKFHEDLVLVYEMFVKEVFSVSDYEDYKLSNKIIEETDAKGSYLLPGFIDVHIHGYKGIDTMEGDPERLEELAETIPMVTINQAKYLGVENRMGTLDQNKEANIVLMNEAFFIETTIVKGKKIYENRL